VCLIEVTEAGERAMQMRVLVSAVDSPRAWNLRCQVREGLIHFIQRDYPQYLPRVRADVNERISEAGDEHVASEEQVGLLRSWLKKT
jgi:hypothetical protein